MKIAAVQEIPKQLNQSSPKDSQRSVRCIAPLQAAARTTPTQVVEAGTGMESKCDNMSISVVRYLHNEELPSVMSRTRMGSRNRCAGPIASISRTSTDAGAQENRGTNEQIRTSVNPNVGGRRCIDMSPLTTSKLNSAVEDTKIDSQKTRGPTPESGQN